MRGNGVDPKRSGSIFKKVFAIIVNKVFRVVKKKKGTLKGSLTMKRLVRKNKIDQ